ncbi:MAG: hypothetical protein PVI86_14570, partial [Phycisphaerae bacterium]
CDAGSEQVGEAAGAGSDLEDVVVWIELGGVDESSHQVSVDQKVLTERFSRVRAGFVEDGLYLALGLDVGDALGEVRFVLFVASRHDNR